MASEVDAKAKAAAAWEKLRSKDKALVARAEAVLGSSYSGTSSLPASGSPARSTPEWMISLGMVPKRRSASKVPDEVANDDEAAEKRSGGVPVSVAAAALAAVKSSKPSAANVEAAAKTDQTEASKRKVAQAAAPPSSSSASATGLDAVLEQIGKKQKVNILDKSKQDWGEFKDEKGLSDELEAYKKSGDKYLEKVAFLQRADVREYEKERDARLAYQAKRRQQPSTSSDVNDS